VPRRDEMEDEESDIPMIYFPFPLDEYSQDF